MITFSTKLTMLCLAGPSFHDGRGSVAKAASVDESGSDGALIDESFFKVDY